jgi:hypothetical protein
MCHKEVFDQHEVLDEEELCVHDNTIALDDSGCLLEGFCGLVHDIVQDITIPLGKKSAKLLGEVMQAYRPVIRSFIVHHQ